jgi:hypothetical protein
VREGEKFFGCCAWIVRVFEGRMSTAEPRHNSRRGYQKSGHYHRVRGFHRKGLRAINGRTYAGQEAKA